MRVAVSTAIGCDATLEVALDRVAQIGCPLVDVLTIDGWVHVSPSKLVDNFEEHTSWCEAQLSQRGLIAIATNSGLGVQLHDRSPESMSPRRERTDALMRFCRRLGIGFGAIQPLQPDRARAWDAVLVDCVASIREQFAAAEAHGLTWALELHVNSPFETVEQADRLLEAMPEVGLVYDPTHFVMQGLPIRETRWLMRRAKHCHFRDAARGSIQTPFGEGEVDFDWVLGALQDEGFAGDASIEYLGTTEFDVVDSAKRLYEALMRRG